MDNDKYERLIMPHRGYVTRYARMLERNSMLAEDLVQEVMCRAAEGLDKLEHTEPKAVRGWLRTITVRAHLDLFNAQSPLGITMMEIEDVPVEDQYILIHDEQQDTVDLWDAIDTLSSKAQVVITLNAAGYTSAQIAERTGMKPDAIRKSLQRSHATLKELME